MILVFFLIFLSVPHTHSSAIWTFYVLLELYLITTSPSPSFYSAFQYFLSLNFLALIYTSKGCLLNFLLSQTASASSGWSLVARKPPFWSFISIILISSIWWSLILLRIIYFCTFIWWVYIYFSFSQSTLSSL